MRFENVWLRYDRRSSWVLQSVDVTLGRGQVAVVLGKNGAGKTTLLSAAAGLLRPERGRILDRPVRVGWVPERFPANQPFTVNAYLVGMARSHGLTRLAALEQVDLWSERLFLTRYLDTTLADLSKGTAQKVGLVQAMIPRPDLLVLDEPWEGLDGQTRDLIPDIVGEVLAVGGSVLVSDHLGEIGRLPGALRWHVEAGRVDHYEIATGEESRYTVELSVPAVDVPTVVTQLRGLGHEVVRARPPRGAFPASMDAPSSGAPSFGAPPPGAPPPAASAAGELSVVPPSFGAPSFGAPSFGAPSFGAPSSPSGPVPPYEPGPAPGQSDVPWHDPVGQDRKQGRVARHAAPESNALDSFIASRAKEWESRQR